MQKKAGKEVKRNREHMGQIENKQQDLNPAASIIIQNINGLNTTMKRQAKQDNMQKGVLIQEGLTMTVTIEQIIERKGRNTCR